MAKQTRQSAKVERLVVLPFLKSVQISLQNIRVRFFRSLITIMSLVLAIAFLAFVNVSNDVANSLLSTNDPALAQALIQSGYDVANVAAGDHEVKSGAKQRWIVMLSLLVCVVGIINAQLMAVTERFREIGTMKCLGALDRFILRLFLIEAVIQGCLGSIIGALAGAGLALINAGLQFGPPALTALLWSKVGISVVTAVGVGTLLSLVGVFYPALVAARMQPVDAMRAEY